jgi:hypothetical protein
LSKKKPKIRIDIESLWAKPEATNQWDKLQNAIEKADSYPCQDKPTYYADNSDEIGVDVAEIMCYGCPILKECYDFAVANKVTAGIWGGINFTEIRTINQ